MRSAALAGGAVKRDLAADAEVAVGTIETDAAVIARGRVDRLRTRRARAPVGRARRTGIAPIWRLRTRIPVRRLRTRRVPDRRGRRRTIPTAARAQIVGRDPTIGAALFDIAPGASALLHVDLFAAAQRIDDGIAGAGTGADIDVTRCDSGGPRKPATVETKMPSVASPVVSIFLLRAMSGSFPNIRAFVPWSLLTGWRMNLT
jgi:hypothetical protein